MDDNELLKFSAKAYGCEGLEYRHGSDRFYYDDPETGRECWCPLDDDGQAFRMSVKLRMNTEVAEYKDGSGCVCVDYDHELVIKSVNVSNGDYLSAVRRAIVLVAAEIGKSL